jgi:hypothetical protein
MVEVRTNLLAEMVEVVEPHGCLLAGVVELHMNV